MIIGHFFLAFSLAALLSVLIGFEKPNAVKIGLFAALFALIPDIDIFYSLKNMVILLSMDTTGFVESFWNSSKLVHRGITHSLLVGAVYAPLFALQRKFNTKLYAVSVLTVSVFTIFLLENLLVSVVFSFYILAGLLIAEKSKGHLTTEMLLLASFIGLLSHPLGDLFTGTPPQLLYPLSITFLEARIVLFQDPVLNLLSVFFIEISSAASAFIAFSYLKDFSITENLSPVVLLAGFFGVIHVFIPQPTLSVSYHFVYSLGFTGIVLSTTCVAVESEDKKLESLAVNLLASLFIGFSSYLFFYLAWGF